MFQWQHHRQQHQHHQQRRGGHDTRDTRPRRSRNRNAARAWQGSVGYSILTAAIVMAYLTAVAVYILTNAVPGNVHTYIAGVQQQQQQYQQDVDNVMFSDTARTSSAMDMTPPLDASMIDGNTHHHRTNGHVAATEHSVEISSFSITGSSVRNMRHTHRLNRKMVHSIQNGHFSHYHVLCQSPHRADSFFMCHSGTDAIIVPQDGDDSSTTGTSRHTLDSDVTSGGERDGAVSTDSISCTLDYPRAIRLYFLGQRGSTDTHLTCYLMWFTRPDVTATKSRDKTIQ